MTGLALRPLPAWLRRIGAGGGKQDLPHPVAHGAGLPAGHSPFPSGGDLGVLAWAHGGVEARGLSQGLRFLRCSHVTKPTRPKAGGQINAHPMLDGANLCAYIRTMGIKDVPSIKTPTGLLPGDEIYIVVAVIDEGAVSFRSFDDAASAQEFFAANPGAAAVVTYGDRIGISYTYSRKEDA